MCKARFFLKLPAGGIHGRFIGPYKSSRQRPAAKEGVAASLYQQQAQLFLRKLAVILLCSVHDRKDHHIGGNGRAHIIARMILCQEFRFRKPVFIPGFVPIILCHTSCASCSLNRSLTSVKANPSRLVPFH